MATEVWYAWVTAANADFAETLCAKLIRRGFTVGPLGRQLITQWEDSPSCVVSFSLSRPPRTEAEKLEYTAPGIHAEIVDIIKTIKGKFWSLVVSQSSACTWNIGNVRFSEEERAKASEAKKVN